MATVAITHVTPHTYYNGAYPNTRLEDGNHDGFTVNVTTHLWAPLGGAKGTLAVTGDWATTNNSTSDNNARVMALPSGESIISSQLTATAKQIKLWGPNGVGAQPLYSVDAMWTPATVTKMASAATSVIATSRRMGFRVFALVTVNDTDPSTVASNASNQVNDTGTHGMFFRVNGAAMYSRGANVIPMEELEGRMDGCACPLAHCQYRILTVAC